MSDIATELSKMAVELIYKITGDIIDEDDMCEYTGNGNYQMTMFYLKQAMSLNEEFEIEKDFTIIYSEPFKQGSKLYPITKCKYIKSTKGKLIETLENDDDIDGFSSVIFIFKGKCEHDM